MRDDERFVDDPPNSIENVLKEVTSKFDTKPGEIPELLSKFIKLLGKEKDEWGGVKAMRVCVKEFLSQFQKPNDNVATCDDFERFLFSPDRVIVIQEDEISNTSKAVIQGDVDPPANREIRKEPDRPSSSKTDCLDLLKATLKEPDRPSSSKTGCLDLLKATLKEPDRPSSSKIDCLDLLKATLKKPDRTISTKTDSRDLSNTIKGTDNPSTTIAVNPATNKKTLKVKIYMGTGWEKDFPNLRRGSSQPPDLFVNLIHGGNIQKTKDHESSWNPSWGEQFTFPLSNLENDELVVKVCDHKDKFAGTARRLVSELEPGMHVIPLSCELWNPCNTARLLMRFTFG